MARITEDKCLDYDVNNPSLKDFPKIQIKKYNTETFTKYLLVCIKALQQEIETLKGEKGE